MKFLNLIRSFISPYPPYLILFVTARCNARCKMCFNSNRQIDADQKTELTIKDIEKLSTHYRPLSQLTLTGGEPFIRNDLHEIVRLFYENSGVRWLTIPTNGFFTNNIINTTENILNQCPKLSINIDLSIDAYGVRHDQIRNLPDGFNQAMKSFQKLKHIRSKHPQLHLKWTTVVSPFNQFHVFKIIQYLSSLGADDHELLLARGTFRNIYAYTDLSQATYDCLIQIKRLIDQSQKDRRKGYDRLFDVLYDYLYDLMVQTKQQKKWPYPCLAGQKMIEIYENGQVVPCEMRKWMQSDGTQGFGNLHDFDFDIMSMLRTSHAKKMIGQIKDCYCTFECAILCSIIYNVKAYPHLIAKLLNKALIKQS